MASWMNRNGWRLDSQPYLSGAVETRLLLNSLSVEQQPLNELTKNGSEGIFNGPRFVRNYVTDPKYGIPFLRGSDILTADLSQLRLISKRTLDDHPELLMDTDWSLITCSGNVGEMTYSRPDMAGMLGSQDFLCVVADEEKVLPGYLYAYLLSRYGVPLVLSGVYGGIIQHIEPQHLLELSVPRIGPIAEAEIHRRIKTSAELRAAYQREIVEATERFFAAIGMKDITATEWRTKGSDLGFRVERLAHLSLRAMNFSPRFAALGDEMRSGPWSPLGEICLPGTLRRAGRYRRIDAEPEFGYQLLGQRELFRQRPEGRWVAKFALGDDVVVDQGTILVAARGTLGEKELYCRSEFVWGPDTSFAYSEDILRIMADEAQILSGCLYAFVRSETFFRMLRSISSGSKILEPHYAMLPQLPVPIPAKLVQQEIHDLVVGAYEKRHESNRLEDEAVALLESTILGLVEGKQTQIDERIVH